MLDQKKQRKKNIAKYGDKNDDVIARSYREGKGIGDIWCAKNAEKYLRRFLGTSEKANNFVDLLKVKNYVDRMIEYNKKHPSVNKKEIIET